MLSQNMFKGNSELSLGQYNSRENIRYRIEKRLELYQVQLLRKKLSLQV